MDAEDRAPKPRGFAGLKSMVSRVDLARLQLQSDKEAQGPDPSCNVPMIRDRQLGKWFALAAAVAYFGWLAVS